MSFKHIVIVELPCPLRVGFFSLNKKKKIGFSFDNLAAFQFRENTGVDTDLKKWVKTNGESKFFAETVWGAAESYAMHNKKNVGISKTKFMLGIAQLSEKESKKLIEAWNHSTTFGSKPPIGKKKAVVSR